MIDKTITLNDVRSVPDMTIGPDDLEDATVSLRFVAAAEFAGVDEPGGDPLVEVVGSDLSLRAAIPTGGFVMVFGDGGAGKTTLLLDLAVHLASGAPWCGILNPVRPLRVALVENEGPRPMMRAKLRAKLASWERPLRGSLHILEEPWGRFTFRNETQRRELAAAIDDAKIDLLVVGPLGRVGMEGAGSTDDIQAFLGHMDAALGACITRPAVCLVHHENRAGTVSGAWEREPDTLIHVQGQGNGKTRVHWAKARWASDLHGTSSHLLWAPGDSFTVDARPEITTDTMVEELLQAVLEQPGSSWTKLRPHIRGNDGDKAEVRDRLVASGQLINTATRPGQFNLWRPDDPDGTRASLSTAPARPTGATPDGASEPGRATVPALEGTGHRHGTDDAGA